jgi:hypothetical protein
MIRMILAAAAAFALVSAVPAFACPDCKDCPMHKVAAADKAEKKEGDKAEKKIACPCVAAGQECKCGAQCQCPHCAAKHAAEKKDEKKS